MSDRPSFTEAIVSMLGTPHDRWGELIGLVVVATAAAAWFAAELGLLHLVARLLRVTGPKDPE